MTTTKLALAGILAGTLALGGCAGAGPNQQVGAVSGALIGGVIGSQFGGGTGERVAAGLVGAAIGGMIGGQLGANLDERDRQLAYAAQYTAFDTGRPRRWQGREAYGEVIPGPSYRTGGSFCREYTHTIYIGGRPQEAYGTACRQPDGSWQIVSG